LEPLILLILFPILALAAWRWGFDSRDGPLSPEWERRRWHDVDRQRRNERRDEHLSTVGFLGSAWSGSHQAIHSHRPARVQCRAVCLQNRGPRCRSVYHKNPDKRCQPLPSILLAGKHPERRSTMMLSRQGERRNERHERRDPDILP
jgi:hypothetical protein